MPAPRPGQLWGILGGVFDPVHLGHLALATDIQRIRRMYGILFVPTFEPPHRSIRPEAAFEDRVQMVRLALDDQPNMEVSRIEEMTGRPSFSLNTVRALKAAFAGVDFELILGADQLGQLPTWHRWKELLDEIPVVVGCRPGSSLSPDPVVPSERIVILQTSLVDVSSTQVRSRIGAGAGADELATLVPRSVAEYIEARNLYR